MFFYDAVLSHGVCMRKENLTFLDLKNAVHRAEWTRRYFSGHFCDDCRSPRERDLFDAWYRRKIANAERFLRGAHDG